MSGFDLTPTAITVAGRYKLTEEIGSGESSMYLATDVRTSEPVAIQVRPVGVADAATVLAFREATEKARTFDHPAMVKVFDAGLDVVEGERVFFIVLEHLSGGSLRDMLDRGRRLTPSQALVVGLDACRALSHAHAQGAIHGDLRPSGLQFGPDRRARLSGIGLAIPTASGNLNLERARYAAPEIGRDEPASEKSDVYSLAVMLVEAITGEVPFASESITATMANKTDRLLPVNADLGPLASVLERAARPEADDRYSAREFGEALVQVASSLPKPTPIDVAGQALAPETLAVSTPTIPSEPLAPVVSIADAKPIVIGGTGEIERGGSRVTVGDATRVVRDPSGPLVIGGANANVSETPAASVAPVPEKRRLALKTLMALAAVAAVIAAGLFTWNTWLIPAHAVPLVKGNTEAEALNTLASLKWDIEIRSERSDDIEAGSVIGTEPEAGTSLKENRKLVLIVSLGPRLRELDNYTGQPVEEVKATLADSGLSYVDGGGAYSEKVKKGNVVRWNVVDQPSLKAGAEVERGTKVRIVVSLGPKPRKVPQLIALTLDEAKAVLAERGLKFVAGPDGVSNFIAVGRVIAQIPAPGVTLPKGSEVIVSVSTGQDLVEMPDVFGKTFDFVKFGLNSQGLKVGEITGNESRALLRAFINGKEVFVGDEVLRGATVDLTFA